MSYSHTTFRRTALCVALSLLFCVPASASSALEAPKNSVAGVYALASAGKAAEAIVLATRALAEAPADLAMLEARAYAYRGNKQYAQALADYQAIHARDPLRPVGPVGIGMSLRALGAAQLAYLGASTRPDLFKPEERTDLQSRFAGALTRMGATDPHFGVGAFELTDGAIVQFGQLAQDSGRTDAATLPGFAGYDYLVAQFNRRRFELVCTAFEALEQGGRVFPDYVVHVAAQSYASLRNPVRALALLEPIAERNKDDVEFLQSYFYALVDNEQHQKAQSVLDAAVARAPLYLDPHNPRLRRPNPSYIRLVTLAAWSRAFDDRLPDAERYFAAALAEAPANESLRDGMGTVRLWGGRPRAARDEYLQAIALSPESIEPRRGLVSTYVAQGDERLARTAIDELLAEHPYDTQTLRLQKDQAQRLGPSVSFGLGNSASHIASGRIAEEYSGRFRFNSTRYSDIWRVFATASEMSSSPDGAKVSQGDRSLGVDVQLRDFAATAALTKNQSGRVGLSLSGRISPLDGLVFSAEGETVTPDIPARAVVQGTHGHRLGAALEWQPRVQTSLVSTISTSSTTDDNETLSVNLRWREMWSQAARHQLWTTASFSHYEASNQDVVYFSPSKHNSVGITWGASLLGSRQAWLARSRWHHFELDTNHVAQTGYPAKGAGALRYRLSWQWSQRVSTEFSFERARRVYDGNPEMQNATRFNMSVAL